MDVDKIKCRIKDCIAGYKREVKSIEPNQDLFRGVLLKDGEGRPNEISRISYPPGEFVKKDQRLNRAGQSMFYCSTASAAAFYECQAKQGDFFVLSSWEVKESLWMVNLGYHKTVLKNPGTQDHNINSRNLLTNPKIQSEPKKNKKIRHKLSKAFTIDVPEGKEYIYKQTIAIKEIYLDDSEIPPQSGGPKINKVAGIVYPAMKLRGDADNVVLLPDIVDSLKIKSAWYIKIEEADKEKSCYKYLIEGRANSFVNGQIEWEENADKGAVRASISLENGRLVYKDGYDRIYACK